MIDAKRFFVAVSSRDYVGYRSAATHESLYVAVVNGRQLRRVFRRAAMAVDYKSRVLYRLDRLRQVKAGSE